MTINRLLFFFLLLLATPTVAQEQADTLAVDSLAQQPLLRFGYLSYDSALVRMPQYAQAMQQVQALRQAYADEMKRVEDEFNQKYEAFLEGRADYPRTILLKRQTELQDMLQRNIDFKHRAQRELQQAEHNALEPLRQLVDQAVAAVARQMQLALVVNTDARACPFIDPLMGVDISDDVDALLMDVGTAQNPELPLP